jgi:hypothetical protein
MCRLKPTSLKIWLGLSISAIASVGSTASVRAGSQLSALEDERVWSRKFLEAKTRLREGRGEHDRLSRKLNVLRSFSCGEDATYYNPYFLSKTEKELERARKELETAEHALADLQESLRRSGKPVSWQDSRLAIEQPRQSASTLIPAVKDKDFWNKQLAIIDKRYNHLIEPLRIELFELAHLRAPNPGEDITRTGFGTCLPPFYSEIRRQIEELRQHHLEERAALMEQARREGALPGWFR